MHHGIPRGVLPLPFDYGVASGDVDATEATIWTRVCDDVRVRWHWQADGQTGSGEAEPDPETGVVRVRLKHLASGMGHDYWFTTEGAVSTRGRFRTLPGHGETTGVRFAVVSCAKYNAGYFSVYRNVAARSDIDFVLHLGDYIYEAADHPPPSQTPGANIGRHFDPLHECRTLTDYRTRYAQYRRDPDLLALHAAHAVIATIDDHELADNAWSGGAEEHVDERHGPWSARLQAALRAWHEWTPTMLRPADGQPIWRALDLCGTAQLLLLEARTRRTGPQVSEPADRTLLGPEQRAWLRDRLFRTERRWTLVGLPSMISSFDEAVTDSLALEALHVLKLRTAGTDIPFHDRWDAYTHERASLLAQFAEAPTQPVVLSGDVHFAAQSHLVSDGAVIGQEWTTSSVTSQNLDDKKGWPRATRSRVYEQRLVASVPHLEWCDLDSHGYLIVEVNAEAVQCEWWAVESVLDPRSTAAMTHSAIEKWVVGTPDDARSKA